MEELFGRTMSIFAEQLKEHIEKCIYKGLPVNPLRIFTTHRSTVTSHVTVALLTGNLGRGRAGMTRRYEIAKSEISAISGPRNTCVFLAKTTKQYKARQLHGSHYGFICPAETPQGSSIGFIKTTAATAEISSLGDEGFWFDRIAECTRPWEPGGARVLMNGRVWGTPIGSLQETYAFLRAQRARDPPFHAAVLLGENEVVVDISPGRWVRPLFVAPHHPGNFTDAVGGRKTTFGELVQLGQIEYVDAAEDAVVGVEPGAGYTHYEIHPSLVFGHSGGRAPFAPHDASPRISFQAESKPRPAAG